MRARHHRFAAVLLLTASLALAGCGASGESSGAAQKAVGSPDADSGYAADKPAAGGAKANPSAPPKQPQHVIRTAELSVEVEDATAALTKARAVVGDAGGHVENETTERVDDDHVTSRIVLRVPQSAYDSALKELAGTGKLLSRKADAKDVTDQVVDVESRIATQRASVARVRELMDRATKLSDVVTLEAQLSGRQADLESLLAQQAALKDRTSMATITLNLSEPEKPAEEPADDGPGFGDALSGGWNALVTTAKWVGIVLLAVAPWAVVFLVAYAVWRWLVRPWMARRTTFPDVTDVTESDTTSS
ncbi:DUF4349 domain-containing protein [Streptomyces sp. CB03238]|uniref:DUF4349 domain-containing protein n=1 Tax=Streptomyces sp. CB03238 TaxID=1907777 RepID=UPI000A10298C|nr:DUF4349 domain-containing protein [Streptomyces sp. CB03238]ORT54551.1 hypothetical protein BKD26_34990 [Streptomyces sp. CB03238]